MTTQTTADTQSRTAKPDMHGGAVHIPRSRGAVSGIALIILGAWAAIIPFIGPLFHYAYTPATAWTWTAARGWLEVLPGVAALIAGVVLMMSANRVTASIGGWIGVAAGVWLVIGRDVATALHLGNPGVPASTSLALRALESIGLFSGVGAAIAVIAAFAVGRLSIRSIRDVRVAQRRERRDEKRNDKISERAYEEGRRDEARHEHEAPVTDEHATTTERHVEPAATTERHVEPATTTDRHAETERVETEYGGMRGRMRHLTHRDGTASNGTASEGATAAGETEDYRGSSSR